MHENCIKVSPVSGLCLTFNEFKSLYTTSALQNLRAININYRICLVAQVSKAFEMSDITTAFRELHGGLTTLIHCDSKCVY